MGEGAFGVSRDPESGVIPVELRRPLIGFGFEVLASGIGRLESINPGGGSGDERTDDIARAP
ncbi:hypothetical protein MPNT_20118 [Candidatus Methylacidithermus pantelleriae]|uniref:Uncharacterized protein n=1 Tax=Candidatus Methylacidithermus pantelleriae TaxID=2744239 RepID=A0A8J2BPB8_9BACT|nr:hypothetical protein MPNT_20118 [Candidatus Methylacidithermus pantelleriae]